MIKNHFFSIPLLQITASWQNNFTFFIFMNGNTQYTCSSEKEVFKIEKKVLHDNLVHEETSVEIAAV